jgi:hypothetical protein
MCCGMNRMQQRSANLRPPSASPYVANQPARHSVSFVYLGNAGMKVSGPISGREYRFEHRGARVEVDPRDRVLLASLRQLRQVT